MPGTSPAARAASGEKPANCDALMMKSARTLVSSELRTEVFTESAKIATSDTSPRPTTSAAAVADVRRGLRIAFPRASVPVTPSTAGNGRPDDRRHLSGDQRTEHDETEEDHEPTREGDRDRVLRGERRRATRTRSPRLRPRARAPR